MNSVLSLIGIRNRKLKVLLFLLIAGIGSYYAKPELLSRGNMYVIDGDTISLAGERIRIWGIDAPERDQICRRNDRDYECGIEAKAALAGLLEGKEPMCTTVDKDQYGRTVARCKVDEVDIGGQMVALGWAVEYRQFSRGAYRGAEKQAKSQKLGLWAGNFEQPSKYRADKRYGH